MTGQNIIFLPIFLTVGKQSRFESLKVDNEERHNVLWRNNFFNWLRTIKIVADSNNSRICFQDFSEEISNNISQCWWALFYSSHRIWLDTSGFFCVLNWNSIRIPNFQITEKITLKRPTGRRLVSIRANQYPMAFVDETSRSEKNENFLSFSQQWNQGEVLCG